MKSTRGLILLVPLSVAACGDTPTTSPGTDAPTGTDAAISEPPADGGDGFDAPASAADAGVDASSRPDAFGPDAPTVDDALRCETTPECPAGEMCIGMDDDGVGRCRDLGPIPGEGDECGSDAECGADLVCTQTSPGGVCVPAWMLGTFAGEGLAIPDDDPTGITTGVSVGGLGTVSTEVVLRFRLQHGRSSDVRVYLSNPSGTEALAWDGNAPGEPILPVLDIERVVSGFPGDESANGRWTLRVADVDPAETGTLGQWSITLRSRFD